MEGAVWSLAVCCFYAGHLAVPGHSLQAALFGNAGHPDRCPVPELLDRGCSLGVHALEMSQGFLLEMSFHKDQICSHSSVIPIAR